MNSEKRIEIMNNVIRVNNEIIDLKLKLERIRKRSIFISTFNFDKYFRIDEVTNYESINKTTRNIILDKYKKAEENTRKDIEKLKKYIWIRLLLLISVKKVVNGKTYYRYFGETIEKNGKILIKPNTVSRGCDITHFSKSDLNTGYIILHELIFNKKLKQVEKTIKWHFDIRSGLLYPIDF